MKLFLSAFLILLIAGAFAQDNANAAVPQTKVTNLYRLRIKHADPYLVYLLLSGRANFQTPPETGTRNKGN